MQTNYNNKLWIKCFLIISSIDNCFYLVIIGIINLLNAYTQRIDIELMMQRKIKSFNKYRMLFEPNFFTIIVFIC